LAGPGCVAPPLGGRTLKGFSGEIEVYAVESIAGVTGAPRASA